MLSSSVRVLIVEVNRFYTFVISKPFQGTGVWNSFELKREKSDDEDEEKDE